MDQNKGRKRLIGDDKGKSALLERAVIQIPLEIFDDVFFTLSHYSETLFF
jgi:hypothetical protein